MPVVLEGENEWQSVLLKTNEFAFGIDTEAVFGVRAPRQPGLLTNSAVLLAT